MFQQLFTAVLRQCTDAGLVGGRRLCVDGTHIEADAALKSLRAELEPIDGDGDGDGDGSVPEACPTSRPALTLAEPRSGPTPKRVASNATAISVTDPDAKLRHKPGHRKHLVHRGQAAARSTSSALWTMATSPNTVRPAIRAPGVPPATARSPIWPFRHAAIRVLTRNLINEIDRLAAADHSTGS